jgi:hypothetical protein
MDIFNECIIHKEFFTFGEKVKLLNYLLKNYPERFHLHSADKGKKIITVIKNVMECRNKFAREEIVVNFKEKTAYIYKNQQNLLSPQSVSEFQHQISYLSTGYVELYINLVIEVMNE